MQALVTTPGEAGTTAVADVAAPRAGPGELLLRTVEVGVCGTDREISEGLFGVAPQGRAQLVLGHELLAVVEHGGHGFARGDVVSATVRRSCSHCAACAEGSPDACFTGDYAERGITRLDGFAGELCVEAAAHLVAIPPALGRLGVLAEPASVCARAIRHVRAVGERQPWAPARALVIGPGAIGMLATC
ncbi:MAG TPA: alcohol dehydrogenase catalytic domain-containing protein, partial [Solirubrobacteraceae bacterium]